MAFYNLKDIDVSTEAEVFQTDNLRHGINGFVYGWLPLPASRVLL